MSTPVPDPYPPVPAGEPRHAAAVPPGEPLWLSLLPTASSAKATAAGILAAVIVAVLPLLSGADFSWSTVGAAALAAVVGYLGTWATKANTVPATTTAANPPG